MKKGIIFLIAIVIMFVFTGCFKQGDISIERIVAPQNIKLPLEGKWKITHCFNKNIDVPEGDVETNPWIGSFAEFNRDEVRMGSYVWRNPEYKTKKVDFEQYALENIGSEMYNKIDFAVKSVYIVSLTSKDDFMLEFIRLYDNRIISVFQDKIMFLQRDSGNTNYIMAEKPIGNDEFQIEIHRDNVKVDSITGVLLGIKYTEDSGEDAYKTLWISRDKGVMNPVFEMDGVFLPRTDGFWKVEIKKTGNGLAIEEYLSASKQFKSDMSSDLPDMNRDFWKNKEGILNKDIVCIGNDFVAMEVRGKGKLSDSGELWNESSLRIYPIDSSVNSDGLSIGDLAGQAGSEAYIDAVNSLKKDGIAEGDLNSMEFSNQRNFTLYRKNGQWLFKGRIDFARDKNLVPYEYNINSKPPENFIKYDILYILWKDIKDKVPEALDAYTSPTQDMAVVLSPTKILVFDIIGGRLADTPSQKINLQKGSSVVMSEWTQHAYTLLWDKAFKSNQTRLVKVN